MRRGALADRRVGLTAANDRLSERSLRRPLRNGFAAGPGLRGWAERGIVVVAGRPAGWTFLSTPQPDEAPLEKGLWPLIF